MSIDIDMQSYAGAKVDPAAVDQVVDTNSYSQSNEDYPVDQSLLEVAPVSKPGHLTEKEVPPESNPQADNFRALREEVDRIKTEREAEKRDHQVQLEMLRANIAQNQQQAKPQESKSNRMFDGMKDDDVPNVSELRQEWSRREADYQARLEELQVQQMHPDYAEVIEKFALPLVKQKPHLAEGIQGATNKALFAYELGKMAQQMQVQKQETQRNQNAERIVENSKKPGTLSQAGGQAALSKADYFASMSDAEFMKMATRNLEGI